MTVEAGSLEVRARAEALMRGTGRSAVSIGREIGVKPNTLSTWNNRYHWRLPAYAARRMLAPVNWPEERRAAVARLHGNPHVDVGDLAVAMGATRDAARALFKTAGLHLALGVAREPPDPDSIAPGTSLRAALHGHIARQIARFDAALQGEAPPGLDSARVLRDLGGLKRLLDDMNDDGQGAGDGAGLSQADRADAGAPDRVDLDLPALRAQIARRYAAFAGEREDAGLPGEPAGGADPGARP